MGNIADEFYDEYYATICPECNENECATDEPLCGHCLLEDLSASYNEDAGFEMGLGLE